MDTENRYWLQYVARGRASGAADSAGGGGGRTVAAPGSAARHAGPKSQGLQCRNSGPGALTLGPMCGEAGGPKCPGYAHISCSTLPPPPRDVRVTVGDRRSVRRRSELSSSKAFVGILLPSAQSRDGTSVFNTAAHFSIPLPSAPKMGSCTSTSDYAPASGSPDNVGG